MSLDADGRVVELTTFVLIGAVRSMGLSTSARASLKRKRPDRG